MPVYKQLVKETLKVQQLRTREMRLRGNGMQHVFLLLTIAKAMAKGSFKNFFIGFTHSALKKGTGNLMIQMPK